MEVVLLSVECLVMTKGLEYNYNAFVMSKQSTDRSTTSIILFYM